MAGDSGAGAYRLFSSGSELVKAYPQLQSWEAPERSKAIELTNFDVGCYDLKPEHKDGIFRGNLMTSDGDYIVAWSFGFHSHTGGQAFNSQLAELRAHKAVRFAYHLRAPGITVRTWKHTAVTWRPGFPDGESAEMRKVLLVYFSGMYPPRAPVGMGPTKTKAVV